MQREEALRLRKAWGEKPCEHPGTEREYSLGFHTGAEVCVRCGRPVAPEPPRPSGTESGSQRRA